MTQASEFILGLLQKDEFVFYFWGFLGSVTMFWHHIYYFRKKKYTEKELVKISPSFKGINIAYIVAGILWFFFCALPIIGLGSWLGRLFMDKYGVLFYPFIVAFFASYGIYQGWFAIGKKVYPMSKLLYYVYDDYSNLRRIGKYQILIAIGIIAISTFSFFFTIWMKY